MGKWIRRTMVAAVIVLTVAGSSSTLAVNYFSLMKRGLGASWAAMEVASGITIGALGASLLAISLREPNRDTRLQVLSFASMIAGVASFNDGRSHLLQLVRSISPMRMRPCVD